MVVGSVLRYTPSIRRVLLCLVPLAAACSFSETACIFLAKVARVDGMAFHTVTKTEVIGVTNISPLVLYFEFQGPAGNVIGAAHSVRAELAKAGMPTPAGVGPTTVVVSKPQGEEACTVDAN
jgi:hypothetical protein